MFTVSPLSALNIRRAYPVACLISPELTLSDWRRYVRRQTRSSQSGLLVARSSRSVMFGIAPWWVQPDLKRDLVLWAGPLIVVEPGAPGRVHGALSAALSRLVVERHCERVQLVEDGDDPGSPMPGLGYSWYGSILQRKAPTIPG